jgi:polyhydroxyalkanoate synthesis repressor PhaR
LIRLIKRYGSRKLYDTEESRYVSLDELSTWIQEGQEIRVIDRETSEDVTSQTLTQVIVEKGRRESTFPPSELLHEMIRRGGDLVTSGVEQFAQRVDRLLRAGAEKVGPLREARAETQILRARLEELEASLSRLEAGEPDEEPADSGRASTIEFPMEDSHGQGRKRDSDG